MLGDNLFNSQSVTIPLRYKVLVRYLKIPKSKKLSMYDKVVLKVFGAYKCFTYAYKWVLGPSKITSCNFLISTPFYFCKNECNIIKCIIWEQYKGAKSHIFYCIHYGAKPIVTTHIYEWLNIRWGLGSFLKCLNPSKLQGFDKVYEEPWKKKLAIYDKYFFKDDRP
jgi:hypothetical protein